MPEYKPTLPLDLTGLNPDNLINMEEHELYTGRNRLIVPKFGSFFKEGLHLYTSEGAEIPDESYMPMELYQDASLRTGKAVFNAIILTDSSIEGTIKLRYQALGGPYCENNEDLIAWFNEFKKEDEGADWDEITDKPRRFPPTHHKQHSRDLYGLEYIVDQLGRLKTAIELQSLDYHNAVVELIEKRLQEAKDDADILVSNIVDEKFELEFPEMLAEQFGLGKISNYLPMTPAIGKLIASATSTLNDIDDKEFYLTLTSLHAFSKHMRELLVSKTNTHIGDTTPTFKEATRGSYLSAVTGEIFVVYSKYETVNNNYEYDDNAYPPDLAETERLGVMKIGTSNTSHAGIWLGIGLESNNLYIGVLPNDMCYTKHFWTKLLVDGELNKVSDLISEHIKDTKNPHEVDKEQVGLGLVENLPVVTQEDMASEKGVFKYVTLDTLMFYTLKWLTNAKAPTLPDGSPDPNRRLMDQDQIIFTQCKKCLTEPDWPNKGQLMKTWCEGTDRFARYTDGEGGYYDEVMHLDSDDCKYYDVPKEGTVLAVWCKDTTKMNTVADGRSGSYDVPAEYKSKDCGYKDPPAAGTALITYCNGTDKMTKFADGEGNSFEVVTVKDSEECGFIKFPPAATVLASWCSGVNEMRRYADGQGGEYETTVAINSIKCGGTGFNEGAANIDIKNEAHGGNASSSSSGGGYGGGSGDGFGGGGNDNPVPYLPF